MQALTVRVREEDETYWAEVVELPGCFASGPTLDELRDALEEAISLYLADDDDPANGDVPPPRASLRIGELKALL